MHVLISYWRAQLDLNVEELLEMLVRLKVFKIFALDLPCLSIDLTLIRSWQCGSNAKMQFAICLFSIPFINFHIVRSD